MSDLGLKEVRDRLGRVTEPIEQLLRFVIGATRTAANVNAASTYALESGDDGLRLAFGHWAGLTGSDGRLNTVLEDALRSAGPFAAYEAARPDPRQRDRLVRFEPPSVIAAAPERTLRDRSLNVQARRATVDRVRAHLELWDRLGIGELHQARVLVCDGPRLLGWYGVFHETVPDRHARAVLQRVAPWLRDRLRLERELRAARVLDAVLGLALDAIAAPALVLAEHGGVEHANSMARPLLEGGDGTLAAALRRLREAGEAPHVDVFTIERPGVPRLRLAVFRSGATRDRAAHARAVQRWRLTPREAQVLDLVVTGDTNADIALTLGCAEATVEIHVSRILRKASASNRTSLVTAYWTLR